MGLGMKPVVAEVSSCKCRKKKIENSKSDFEAAKNN